MGPVDEDEKRCMLYFNCTTIMVPTFMKMRSRNSPPEFMYISIWIFGATGQWGGWAAMVVDFMVTLLVFVFDVCGFAVCRRCISDAVVEPLPHWRASPHERNAHFQLHGQSFSEPHADGAQTA